MVTEATNSRRYSLLVSAPPPPRSSPIHTRGCFFQASAFLDNLDKTRLLFRCLGGQDQPIPPWRFPLLAIASDRSSVEAAVQPNRVVRVATPGALSTLGPFFPTLTFYSTFSMHTLDASPWDLYICRSHTHAFQPPLTVPAVSFTKQDRVQDLSILRIAAMTRSDDGDIDKNSRRASRTNNSNTSRGGS